MIPISYNARSLLARRSTTAAAALGIALVVWVFASALMLSASVKEVLSSSGSSNNAIVLRKGSQAELNSSIEDQTVSLLRASPEAKAEGNGTLSSGEIVVLISANKRADPTATANLVVRGVMPESLTLREKIRVIEGRPFTPGSNEVIVGKGLAGRLLNLEMNQEYPLKPNRSVKVVGVFDAAGSSFESEIWGDLDTIRTVFGRAGMVSSVTLRLKDEGGLDAFKARLESDPRLGLEVKRETTYYEEQSQGLSLFINVLGIMIAVFASVGAMIGAMITMYAQVAQRGKEIGTLRALGFRRRSILGGFLIESVMLSVTGGALGVLGALAMRFVSFPMISFATFSEVNFGFRATPEILVEALVFASMMGLLGGLFPAVRAAKVNPIIAMRG